MPISVSPTADACDRPGESVRVLNRTTSSPAALLTIDDVAATLNCSTRHVRRLLDSGSMPAAIRVGKLVRFRRSDFERWVETGCGCCH